MADLTITAASVLATANTKIEHGVSGATLTAGKWAYYDGATTGKWQLADSDAVAAAARGQGKSGMVLNSASDGQPVAVATDGDVTVGAVLTAGAEYVLSDDPGGICPRADLATGDYVTILGAAKSTSLFSVGIKYTGVVT